MSVSSRRASRLAHFSRLTLLTLATALVPTVVFAQNGTVSGTVTNGATAAPVPNVTVTLCADVNGGSSCFGTSTNSTGLYTRSVPAGTYYAYTSNSGLVNEAFDNVACPGSACTAQFAISNGTPIVVAVGATVSGRNFALDPGGSVAGIVVDAATAAPIANITVGIYTRIGTTAAFSGSRNTDSSGAYSVSGLPTGTYYALTSNGIGYTNEIYDDVLCAGTCSTTLAMQSGTAIAVVSGQITGQRNFALDVGGRITGIVTNASNSAPVQNATVVAYTRIGDSITSVVSAVTNASGAYSIAGLPTATYYVTTTFNPASLLNEIFNNLQCVGSCSLSLPNPGSPVAVTLGATSSGVDFQLDPGGTVSGTVTDAATGLALQGVVVTIYRQLGTGVSTVASGATNSAGVYSVSGLPSGAYFAVASSTTHIDEVYNNISCGATCQTSTILSGAPVNAVAGVVTPGINFALDAGASIGGTVTNATSGAPIGSVSVSVYTRVGTTAVFAGNGFTNGAGVWTLGGLPAGTYYAFTDVSSQTVRWRNEIYDNIPCASTFCSAATATTAGTPIAVAAGATRTGIDFALGQNTDAPGAPNGFGATVNAFTAQFSWSAPTTGGVATSYIIEAGVASGQTVVTFTTTGTSYTIPGVPPGRFYLRVRGVNAAGQGAASSEYVLVVNPDGSGVLQPPQSFAARINGARLTLTWADPSTGGVPTSYLVEVGTAAGLSNIAAVPVGSRNFTFQPVPNGVYFIRIRARNGAQLSPPSVDAMIVVGNVPSPPEAPRSLFHTISGGTLTLTWQLPFFGTPTNYMIEAGTASGLSDIAAVPTGSTALSATFTGVPPGTYYVRVRAVNAQGASVASNERTVTVQ